MSPTSTVDQVPKQPVIAARAAIGPVQSRTRRRPLSRAERSSLIAALIAVAGFAVYGVATDAPSTVAYVASVLTVGAFVLRLRIDPLPAPLASALAFLAATHLAGGLVRVGGGVLYNAHLGSEVFQYDHLVHSSAVFVGTLVLWEIFARRGVPAGRAAPPTVILVVLAGLGLGAVNETVEFLTTMLNQGSYVGGYTNTG